MVNLWAAVFAAASFGGVFAATLRDVESEWVLRVHPPWVAVVWVAGWHALFWRDLPSDLQWAHVPLPIFSVCWMVAVELRWPAQAVSAASLATTVSVVAPSLRAVEFTSASTLRAGNVAVLRVMAGAVVVIVAMLHLVATLETREQVDVDALHGIDVFRAAVLAVYAATHHYPSDLAPSLEVERRVNDASLMVRVGTRPPHTMGVLIGQLRGLYNEKGSNSPSTYQPHYGVWMLPKCGGCRVHTQGRCCPYSATLTYQCFQLQQLASYGAGDWRDSYGDVEGEDVLRSSAPSMRG